jgi:hypothetical protein
VQEIQNGRLVYTRLSNLSYEAVEINSRFPLRSVFLLDSECYILNPDSADLNSLREASPSSNF